MVGGKTSCLGTSLNILVNIMLTASIPTIFTALRQIGGYVCAKEKQFNLVGFKRKTCKGQGTRWLKLKSWLSFEVEYRDSKISS